MSRLHPHLMQPNLRKQLVLIVFLPLQYRGSRYLISRRWRHPSRDTISFKKSYQLPLLSITVIFNWGQANGVEEVEKAYRKPESPTVISGEKSVTSHSIAGEHLDINSQPVILGQLLAASHPRPSLPVY